MSTILGTLLPCREGKSFLEKLDSTFHGYIVYYVCAFTSAGRLIGRVFAVHVKQIPLRRSVDSFYHLGEENDQRLAYRLDVNRENALLTKN